MAGAAGAVGDLTRLASQIDHGAPEHDRRRPPEAQVMSGMINRATMLATLIIGLIAGPAVSL